MEHDDVKSMECVARVIALSVSMAARLEAMKAENSQRESQGKAMAYGEEAFFAVGESLLQATRSEIGL
jgi:hypothetical protein